jgi:methyl-accepting chemotaxis protein
MKDQFMRNNAAKVNKIIASILWLNLISSTFLVFMKQQGLEVYLSLAIELILSTYLIYKKKSEVLTMAILFLGILTSTVSYIGTEMTGMIIITVLCLVSLYLNKSILYIFCALYSLSYSIIYYSTNRTFDTDFFTTIGFVGITAFVLYFVCKRSANLIQLSMQKEMKSNELLHSLNNMFCVIHENTSSLNNEIDTSNRDIETLREISDAIANNVKEITEGVSSQSKGIANISEMMNKADEKMFEINQLSKNLADISENTAPVVLQGSANINLMRKQMTIIDSAVTESITTVEELNKSMDEVNNFLSSIKRIAEQTNLLALNASIEASRAGEAGKGFTVVANEIKKLAGESSDTVKQINQIINNIKTKTKIVFEKAKNGGVAVKEGDAITKQVLDSFDKIHSAFTNMDSYIAHELTMTDSGRAIFHEIRKLSEDISQISKKHTAAMEEMLATIEEQNANIDIIFDSIRNINHSSMKLQELIELKESNDSRVS